MYHISEQQALELSRRCNAIKNVSDPVVFSQIEALVQQAVSTKQITNDEVNQLYELLNCAVVINYSEQEEDKDVVQNEWDKPFNSDMNQDNEEAKLRDRRNHLLLCSKANLRTIETIQDCIKLITVTGMRNVLTQEIRR